MEKLLLGLLRAVTVALMVALVAVPCGQIFFRGVLGMPFIGAEEFARFLLICLVFLGYPLVVAADDNIVMAELRNVLPAPIGRILGLVMQLMATVAAAIISYATLATSLKNLNNATPTLGIPFWLFLSATFIAFFGALLLHVGKLLRGRVSDTTTIS